MGRGLSQQQKEILELLPWITDSTECSDVPTTREVVDMLGLEFTPPARASVSRAISRLQDRGLVLYVWGWHRGYRQRTGYGRATPEQVEAFRQRKAKTGF